MEALLSSVYRYALIAGLLFFTCSVDISAQSDTLYPSDQFLFSGFSTGVVKMKNGEKVILNLNYNIVTERMVFKQKEQIFDMINYGSVDTVYIHQRKFIPSGRIFYELLVSKPVTLFLQNKGTVKQPSRPAAYGGTSDVSSSDYINNIQLGNDRFRMANDVKIAVDFKPVLWLRKDNKLYAIINKKQLANIFPDREKEVKEFIRTNRLNIGNPDQIINLVDYYVKISGQEKML
ncbi:MAG: hypothetical protein IQL11_17050 [Bacteroidales bacterium]|nr:hypothetical protein [Bacteroidales bacterium]